MSENHPYLKAHRRWKGTQEYWERYCKPYLTRDFIGSPISDYQAKGDILFSDFFHIADYKTKSKIILNPYPDLDFQDKYFDGIGYYDKMRNIIDHMETA
jgi:hypothetical protein|tara:strand:- start:231 stop:527 length:297 start_codon:yes stop_codon:yes gene_type:complete